MDYSFFFFYVKRMNYTYNMIFSPIGGVGPALLCQIEVYLTDPSHEKMAGLDFKVW